MVGGALPAMQRRTADRKSILQSSKRRNAPQLSCVCIPPFREAEMMQSPRSDAYKLLDALQRFSELEDK